MKSARHLISLQIILPSLLFILLFLSGCFRENNVKPLEGSEYGSLTHDGIKRTYLMHLPATYNDGDQPLPLVIALHGGGGSGAQFEKASMLSEKADKENFIVVYPDGSETEGLLKVNTWNVGHCCGKNTADDIGFISALVDDLSTRYRVNPKKIYATGHSNGAMMCYRIADELSSRIAAIASNAGSLQIKEVYDPSRNVPVIHIHSKLDKNIPFNGGYGEGISDHYNPPLDSTLNVVASWGSCTSGKGTVNTFPLYSVYKWEDCSNSNFEVLLYFTEDGGHTWPGGNQGNELADDEVSKAFSNNDIIWTFFQKHPLP